MLVDDTSATKPWVMAPPAVPRPDTAKTRSPVLVAGASPLHVSRGWLGLLMIRRARSWSSCHVHSVALMSWSPWRTNTGGPGWCVAARIVFQEVRSRAWLLSEATTNAEPTDGWPASSRVCTNQIDGATF